MTIRKRLDRLALAVSLADPGGEDGLREVLEHLTELQSGAEQDVPEVLARASRDAGERIDSLLGAEQGGAEGALELLSGMMDFAWEVVRAVEGGGSLEGLCPPWEAPASETTSSEAREPEVDSDLLELFIVQCGDTLKEVEGQLLGLEGQADPADTVAEIRRRMHTFKGECGVLSLHTAQELCHEAETLIERTEATRSIPVDLLLALVDWLGQHVLQLRESLTDTIPGHEELLEQLRTSAPEEDASSADARVEFGPEALEDETLPDFIQESIGHLEDVEAGLLEREQDPDDVEIVNRIFRAFHTIKGVAGFLNLEPIVRLAHKTETLLDEFRSERQVCTEAHTDLVFRSKDMLGAMISALTGEESPLVSEVDALVRLLGRAIDGDAQPSPPAAPDAAALVLDVIDLNEPDEIADVAAKPSRVWQRIGDILLERSVLDADALQAALDHQRVEAEAGRKRKVGEILVELGLVSQSELDSAAKAQGQAQSPMTRLLKAEVPSGPPKKIIRKVITGSFVKVNTQRLDALVDVVGELVIAQQMVSQEPALKAVDSQALTRKLGHVAKITRDLQEGAMSLRMVTLKSAFQKMARLVRDLSGKSGKEVVLNVVGEDTELDRNVVEQIGDPLVHLIRNAVDHGLEPAAERLASGKPATGVLELSAHHQGGSIVIEVKDDGRGLDCDRIFQKALERGLVPAGTARDELGDDEIRRMIFQAGFSTAAQVSDISGRGVGMDVVRRNIEGMRGKIEIRSEQGKGSTIALCLPLTLAIIDGMVVRVGSRRYVIPTLAIEQTFQPDRTRLHEVPGDGQVVDARGALLPVHRIKSTFALPDGIDDVEQGILLLLESSGRRACFLVDEILGQQQVVIKNLGKALAPMEGVSGGAILGDGRVALIVDVDGLLARAQSVPA